MFDWLCSNVSVSFQKSFPEKCTVMYRDGIKYHAFLLYKLHYDAAWTKKRLKDNIQWEFEKMPDVTTLINEVDRIVDDIYQHGLVVYESPLTPQNLL